MKILAYATPATPRSGLNDDADSLDGGLWKLD
jgi:hypothetical protein